MFMLCQRSRNVHHVYNWQIDILKVLLKVRFDVGVVKIVGGCYKIYCKEANF